MSMFHWFPDRKVSALSTILLLVIGLGCARPQPPAPQLSLRDRVEQYAVVRLTTDLDGLTPNERRMLPLLIDAAEQMHRAFWKQACGEQNEFLGALQDSHARRFAEINCGPWDRLKDREPFIAGIGPRPQGANFYPHDMTREEFEEHLAKKPGDGEAFKGEYTVIRRDPAGRLTAVPYHQAFAVEVQAASGKLREAAALAEDPALKKYLELRAQALLTDKYRESDLAWMDVKDCRLDCLIGPIEHYEDELFGYKTSFEGMVLVRDAEWSDRLAKYVALLPGLQRGLPVPDAYKAESPGGDSGLGVYDAVYCAGDSNAGGKSIAANLPNDETIQLQKGARRLQFKNLMRAKHERIDAPIAALLVAPDQRDHVRFEAFFQNVLFHEVAHGLGIKNTLDGRGPAREVLKDAYSVLEEAKADMLGLHLVAELRRQGHITEGELLDNYVSYLADMMRLIRWGAEDEYGQAMMLIFHSLTEAGGIIREGQSGTYRVDPVKMQTGVEALVAKIIILQGDGDYTGAKQCIEKLARMDPQLEVDIKRLQTKRIPIDIVFEQGPEVLGLTPTR